MIRTAFAPPSFQPARLARLDHLRALLHKLFAPETPAPLVAGAVACGPARCEVPPAAQARLGVRARRLMRGND